MTDAADLLGRRLNEVGNGFGRIVTMFHEVVGPDLARVATPTSLKRGTLTIRCSSAAWAQTISLMELDLVDRLAAHVGRGQVRRIVARAGGPPAPRPEDLLPPPADPLPPLPPEEEQQLEAMVSSITDPELRARVLAAARASRQRLAEGRNPAS